MQPASSTLDFLDSPNGRYFRGSRFAMFAHSPTLLGFVIWGKPDAEDVRELLRLSAISVRPDAEPHRFLADVRALELVEPATFSLFLDYTRNHREALGRNILRQAQLRPDGLVGAIISGFSHVARLPYPEKVFGDAQEALAWLDVERSVGADLLGELDAIRSAALESYPITGRLRRELETHGALTVEDAGRRLGLSTRSFQRALRDAGTTYRGELKSFRIRRAQELLRSSDRKLAWIAAELGFSSVQHFATAYRRATGDTPSGWRTSHGEACSQHGATSHQDP